MSSKESSQRLQIECQHNQRLRVLYLCFIFVAGIGLLLVPLSWTLAAFSELLIIAVGVHIWNLRCELGGESVSLLWDGEGRWWWRQGGTETELHLCGDSYLSTWLLVLNLYDPAVKRGYSLLVFPSSTGKTLYRRLTVRLKLEGVDVTREGSQGGLGGSD